jgi:benzil reductase ((S)-benzoin forming)
VFVVTGGGSGIGRALTKALVVRGQSVMIVGRRVECLQEVSKFSSNISYISADVSTDEGLTKIVHALADSEKLKGLVHNAGIIDPILPMSDLSRTAWRNVMATNLDAPFFLTQALKEKLVGGRVLNIGSGAAYFPISGWAPYCVSKAGLSMLTRCWQLECPDVAFASVMPGIIDTDMQALIRQSMHMDEEKHAFFVRLKNTQQLLTVENVAAYLVWLLLDVDLSAYCSKEWDIYESFAESPDE